MNEDQRRRYLTEGLVGDRVEEYHTLPDFHAAINLLVQMAPAIVDALAESAQKSKETRDAMIALIERRPMT